MSTGKTRIQTATNLEQNGKQKGFLRLPHSVHRSGLGWIPIPIASIRNGAEPRVLLMAGNHGDEYEGQVAQCKLIRGLDVDAIRGQIIILPAANFPAVSAGLRTSPIDGGNLNRSFPGDPDGSPTAMIAHYIESELLPMSDYLVDVHSGGGSLMYLPATVAHGGADIVETDQLRALQRAFGAPYGLLFPKDGADERMSYAATHRSGTIALITDLARIIHDGTRH